MVEDGLPEVGVVEDALEDLVVGVHAGDDGVDELAVEDEPEVVEVFVAAWAASVVVGGPGLLELVEEQLVGVGQVEAEPLVEDLDDLREVLGLGLVLRPSAVEDRDDLAVAASSETEPSKVFSMPRWVSSTSVPRSSRSAAWPGR